MPEQLTIDWNALDPPDAAQDPRTVTKTFRFRLYPTKTQAEILHAQIDEACRLYNAALEERKTAYRKCGISVSCYDQTKEWTQVRHDGNTTLVHYKIGQDVLQRVDKAFDAFFRFE